MPSTTGDQRAVRLGLGLGEARRGRARLQQRWQRGVGEGSVLTELRGAWWLQPSMEGQLWPSLCQWLIGRVSGWARMQKRPGAAIARVLGLERYMKSTPDSLGSFQSQREGRYYCFLGG